MTPGIPLTKLVPSVPHALPPLSLDYEVPNSPALQLDLTVRPGVTPVELGTDLFRLCSAVNSLAPSRVGGGLTADGYVKLDGNVRMVMRFVNSDGAKDRLAQLVSTINSSAECVVSCPSISRCEATLVCAV